MWRRATFGVAVCLVGLVACGAAATPTARPTTPATTATSGTMGATLATPPAVATPATVATAAPPLAVGTPAAAVTPARTASPASASPTRAMPVAPWPSNAFLQLIYGGRAYLGFWSLPATGGPTAPAGVGTPELGPVIARTFARWQTANLAPAGTAIHGVVGQPPERMLAVRVAEGTVFYHATDRPGELERLAVVTGTVREQGAARWDTPNGSPPPDDDGIYFAPLHLENVRTIQGVALVEDGLLEVRQFVAPPGRGNTAEARADFGELAPLQPGDTILAFLWIGGAFSAEGTPGLSAPHYHWTTPNRLYALRDGAVTPLSAPADADLSGVPEGEFLAGVAEAFRGVTAIDLRTYIPTIPSAPTALPAPRVEVGAPINLAQQYGLSGAEIIDVARADDPRNRYPIVAGEQIAALVAALDRPLAVTAILPQKSADDPRSTVYVTFRVGLTTLVTLEYDTAAGILVVGDNYSRRFSLPAPPGFARAIGAE